MRYPFMSVVVPSFNGAKIIGRTIESLLAQEYPADRFEIIIIDDCSTDDTYDVSKRYGVKVVTLPVNMGISGARNAGLDIAKGDIYVAIDDDCIAYPKLLMELAKGYSKSNPVGVGSFLAPLKQERNLIEGYMGATATGPAVVIARSGDSLIGRFWQYLSSKNAGLSRPLPERVVVHELYGANGSFPVDVLRQVGGWDPEMSGIEDRDLCLRIKKAYPGREFYLMSKAKILHQPDMTLAKYLLRPYRRGLQNLLFHKRYDMTPPIFPFPLLTLGLLVMAVRQGLGAVLVMALLAPMFLYFWWPYRAVRQLKPVYVLFAYIQLAEESMVIAGLIRGFVIVSGAKLRAGKMRANG